MHHIKVEGDYLGKEKKQNDIYQENAQRNSLLYKQAKTLVRTLKIQPKKYNIMRPKCNYRTV